MKIRVTAAHAGQRLDKIVTLALPGLGRAAARRLFDEGAVRVAREGARPRRAQKGDLAVENDELEIGLDHATEAAIAGGDLRAAARAVPESGVPLAVIVETPHAVVVDKPAGQPTAPLTAGERGTLANALVGHYPEMAGVGYTPREPGLCHRLDTDTSGCVLAARTAEGFDVLATALREGRIDKRYLAICASRELPEVGTIDIPLAPHPKDKKRVYACIHPRDVARYSPRSATTEYRVLEARGELALVEVRAPRAVRHQIRAHFAAIGHPLLGDVLYGGAPFEGLARHALHAASLSWGGDRTVPAFTAVSPLPHDLARLVAS